MLASQGTIQSRGITASAITARGITSILSDEAITPAFSLNFLGGMPGGLTYTNSSTTRTYFGSDGLLKTAAANEPIFEYNPVTLALLGMRWEMEQRTNYLRHSGDFTQSQWAIAGGTKTGGQPDSRGGNAATLITGPSVGVPKQDLTAVVSGAHSLSIVCKGVTGTDSVQFCVRNNTTATLDTIAYVNPNTGQILGGSGWTSVAVGNGFFKYTKTTTVTITAGDSISVYFGRTSVLPSDWNLICDYAQLEAGASASSYIPTAGSAVIRQPDVLTATSISPWYRQDEGTVVFEGIANDLIKTSDVRSPFGFGDGTVNEAVCAYFNSSGSATSLVRKAGVTQAGQATANAAGIFNTHKVALAYKKDSFAIVLSGGPVANDLSGDTPTGVTQLRLGIGPSGASPFMGYARRFDYYNTRFPDSTIKGLSRV